MATRRTAPGSHLPEDWRPSRVDIEYAECRGVNWELEAEKFFAHHAGLGTKWARWDLAWRTWCLKCVEWGRASGQRRLPLFSVVPSGTLAVDAHDPFGARAWAMALPDVEAERFNGELRPAVNGYDVVGAVGAICAAAALAPTWRGDLDIVADWLRADVSPDAVVAVIARLRKPSDLRSLRYYDAAVREVGLRRPA